MKPRLALWVLVFSLSGWSAVEDDLRLGRVFDRVTRGDVAYLALESGGVAVVDVAVNPPQLIRRLAEGHVFSRLLLDGEVLLGFEVKEEAVRSSLKDPRDPLRGPAGVVATELPAPPLSVPPVREAVAARGRVTAVTEGRVLFDAGTAAGFTKGSRLKVISQRSERKPDLMTGQLVDVPSGQVTAVLEVEDAQSSRAMAVLGRGDTAEVGDVVELTTAPLSERLLAPRRAPFQFRAGFEVRPFLGLQGESKPVGLMLDAYVHWYLPNAPVLLSLSGIPLGVAFNTKEAHYPGVVAFTAAYATDFFEIGLGIGGLYGNVGPCEPLVGCEVNTGVTINQVLRLGALDGLHLEWHSSIFSRPNQFVFGVGRGVIGVPLNSRLSLFGAGGGGENGWATGEFGVRTALGGAGGRGTVILSASLGVSGIFDGPSHENVIGPAVSFGAEWRL